jgi:hypothetical protein
MRLLATGGVALIESCCTTAQSQQSNEPISIQKQGSFAVGGKILGDANSRSLHAITATSTTRFR